MSPLRFLSPLGIWTTAVVIFLPEKLPTLILTFPVMEKVLQYPKTQEELSW